MPVPGNAYQRPSATFDKDNINHLLKSVHNHRGFPYRYSHPVDARVNVGHEHSANGCGKDTDLLKVPDFLTILRVSSVYCRDVG